MDGLEERTELAEALNKVAGFLRGRLGREIDMKFTPKLNFIPDRSYDEATAIDRLLDSPHVKQDLS